MQSVLIYIFSYIFCCIIAVYFLQVLYKYFFSVNNFININYRHHTILCSRNLFKTMFYNICSQLGSAPGPARGTRAARLCIILTITHLYKFQVHPFTILFSIFGKLVIGGFTFCFPHELMLSCYDNLFLSSILVF